MAQVVDDRRGWCRNSGDLLRNGSFRRRPVHCALVSYARTFYALHTHTHTYIEPVPLLFELE